MSRCCCCCYYLLRRSSSNNNHSNDKKQHSSSMRIAPKQVNCISVIYNTFTYALCLIHMLQLIDITISYYWCYRYYDQLLMGPNQIYPTFWINILQDLHGQSSHFQVLMRFLKRAKEAASQISIGTCCQSWLARYGIASSPYFSERGFSVWKMWKFRRLYVFSLNLKISFIMSGECPFRYL